MSKTPEQNEVGTTGHEWDGIQEWNNPLPRWWLWTFYITIIWGIAYTIAYPAWPLVSSVTQGVLGYSMRAEVQAEIDAVNERNAGLMTALASADLSTIRDNDELHSFAVNAGSAVFKANCSQCHGAGGGGVQASGYPSLADDAWLWGGTTEEIAWTVANGIRNEQSPDARWSQMPAFGDVLSEEEIASVVQHVLAISGNDHDATLAAAGAGIYAEQCAGCHGDEGRGDRAIGAPNLTDAIWLYGDSPERLTETITMSRFGVMPAWGEEWRPAGGLSEAEVNAVAVYVHQLGGGE